MNIFLDGKMHYVLVFDRPTFPSDRADFGDNASGPSCSQEFVIFKITKGNKKINSSWINYSTY